MSENGRAESARDATQRRHQSSRSVPRGGDRSAVERRRARAVEYRTVVGTVYLCPIILFTFTVRYYRKPTQARCHATFTTSIMLSNVQHTNCEPRASIARRSCVYLSVACRPPWSTCPHSGQPYCRRSFTSSISSPDDFVGSGGAASLSRRLTLTRLLIFTTGTGAWSWSMTSRE